jgi:hypothetical protein
MSTLKTINIVHPSGTPTNLVLGNDGSLTVANNLTVTANTTISGKIVVTGNATFSNTVTVTGNAVFSNTIAVTGNATFSNTVTVAASGIKFSDATVQTTAAGATPAALSTASGSAPSYSARAWVNFDGTGTIAIRGSGNVSSITDNGTGDYTANLTTALPDTNGVVVVGGGRYSTGVLLAVQGVNAYLVTASTARMVFGSDTTTLVDSYDLNVVIIR